MVRLGPHAAEVGTPPETSQAFSAHSTISVTFEGCDARGGARVGSARAAARHCSHKPDERGLREGLSPQLERNVLPHHAS